MTQKKQSSQRITVNSVSNALDTHEKVCAERWSHAYKRFDRIESMITTNNARLWWIAGVLISLLGSLVVKAYFL